MKKQIQDLIYNGLTRYDINPLSKTMAKMLTDDICKYISNEWEGKFVNGDFFLKQKNGEYVSMNSLRELPKQDLDSYLKQKEA